MYAHPLNNEVNRLSLIAPSSTACYGSGCLYNEHIQPVPADGRGALAEGLVPYNVTLTALSRTAAWFEVDHHGEKGWISANYVIPQGNCD